MHAYIINSRGLRKHSPQPSSRFKLKIDPQNSSIATFRFCSEDTPSSGFVLSSRLLQDDRPLIERVACNHLLNDVDAYSKPGNQYSPGIDDDGQDQLSPMPRNLMRRHSFFSKTAPAHSGRSASTTLPSLVRSPNEEDVFTESKPLDPTKRSRRGDTSGQRTDIRSLPTLPTLSSDSSGSSISTLATPASPSPAPRHVRRAQGRLSLPMPTPTPAAAEPPSRRAHARMSLMFPLPTPGASATGSRAAYRNSLDLSELARCRLWDAKGNDGRDNVRVRGDDKEYGQSVARGRL
jgi:hypothetical protein